MPGKFGDWLRSLREGRGLAQQAVEEKSRGGISRVYLSLLERGEKKNPTAGLIVLLAQVYDVQPRVIFQAYEADTLGEPLPRIPPAEEQTKPRHGRGIAKGLRG